jgi:putative sterol carrier protein
MIDATEEFFAGLADVDRTVFRNATGTVRFELVDNDTIEYWLVVLDKGTVRAFRAPEAIESETVVRANKALLDEIMRGVANTTTAMLRGALSVEGDLELLWLLQRVIGRP